MAEKLFNSAPDLLTVEECAKLLSMSRDTVWRMAKSGDIPAAKLGRRWYIPKAQLVNKIDALISA